MQKVKIVNVQPAGYLHTDNISGRTGAYTLQRGEEFVSCDEVLIMEQDEEILQETFEDWKAAAQEGEEGYEYWTA